MLDDGMAPMANTSKPLTLQRSSETGRNDEHDDDAEGRPMSGQHRWSQDDETACVGAWYAHDGKVPISTIANLARLIGTTEASVTMKMGNITGLVSGGGPSRAAAATRVTVTRFASMAPTERRDEARAATDRLRGGDAAKPVDPAELTDAGRARIAAAAQRRRDRTKR